MANTVICSICKNNIKRPVTNLYRADSAVTAVNRGEAWRIPLKALVAGAKAVTGLFTTAEQSLYTCENCKNKRVTKDTTDNSKQFKEVATKLEANVEKISELESKLGKGGDEIKIATGDMLVQCGVIMNDTPSYRVDPQASPVRRAVADGGQAKVPGFAAGGRTNAVVGLNPLPTPGGEYTLVCTNKYKLIVGNRGIEIKTGGPVTIDGGITRITGPQVTVGTSTSRLVLEGDVVNINGTSIEMTPNGNGQVVVAGTLGVTGNTIVGGHVHAENISFVGATCVAKNETSTTGAPADLVSGPALRSGTPNLVSVKNGLISAINDLIGHANVTTSDVRKIAGLLFSRSQFQLLDKMKNVIYNTLPMELAQGVFVSPTLPLPFVAISKQTALQIRQSLLPSGYCLYYLGTPSNKPYRLGIMYSFPHVHAIHDGEHSHVMKTPNITLVDSGDQVRQFSSGASSNAPKAGDFEEALKSLLAAITKASPTVGSLLNKLNPFNYV